MKRPIRGGGRPRLGWSWVSAIGVTHPSHTSESLHPSHSIRVTQSESLNPSHSIRVAASESLAQVTPFESLVRVTDELSTAGPSGAAAASRRAAASVRLTPPFPYQEPTPSPIPAKRPPHPPFPVCMSRDPPPFPCQEPPPRPRPSPSETRSAESAESVGKGRSLRVDSNRTPTPRQFESVAPSESIRRSESIRVGRSLRVAPGREWRLGVSYGDRRFRVHPSQIRVSPPCSVHPSQSIPASGWLTRLRVHPSQIDRRCTQTGRSLHA
jgi:hypothetical protein